MSESTAIVTILGILATLPVIVVFMPKWLQSARVEMWMVRLSTLPALIVLAGLYFLALAMLVILPFYYME